jgi:putative endonuclease
MPPSRKELGALGEKLALEHLRKRGYKIRETNFRCRQGEIDIIAQQKDCLVFIEVRTRTGSDFGTPEESVTAAKKEKLVSLALAYLQTHRNLPSSWRFDVVAVELDRAGQVSRIELIQDAI